MHMKMAKPSDADFDAVLAFLQAVESVFEDGVDAETGAELDEGIEMMRSIERRWDGGAAYAWQRVLWAGKTAIDNCCDPNATTLEHKPEIAAAIAACELIVRTLDDPPSNPLALAADRSRVEKLARAAIAKAETPHAP